MHTQSDVKRTRFLQNNDVKPNWNDRTSEQGQKDEGVGVTGPKKALAVWVKCAGARRPVGGVCIGDGGWGEVVGGCDV